MRKYLTVLIAIFFLLIGKPIKAQINLLNTTEDIIKDKIPIELGGHFDKATYTKDGFKVLFFDYPTKDQMFLSTFYLDDAGHCFMCVYTYKGDTLLNALVESIKSADGYVKVPDKFIWVNQSIKCYVKFVRDDESKNISVAFNKMK